MSSGSAERSFSYSRIALRILRCAWYFSAFRKSPVRSWAGAVPAIPLFGPRLSLPFFMSLFGRSAIPCFLEFVELLRAGLDAKVLGDHAPSLALVRLVLREYDLLRLVGDLGDFEHHVGVGRRLDARKDGFHLRGRDAELRGKLYLETRQVRIGLHVQAS